MLFLVDREGVLTGPEFTAEKESGRLDELAEEYIYRYIETEETLEPAA